ncbi:MAG: class I SAM-dependent methyltransferase [Dehalococcoidia bacterium]
MERHLGAKVRRIIVGEAHGRVLEIGVGTGASFSYYPHDAQVIGIEPDPYMLARAEGRRADDGFDQIELRQAPAEQLPFEDASFDHVVSTLVLCTVRDVPQALAEARRVLRPGGTLRFFEHVRNDESRFWGVIQDAIVPIWSWIGAGCHPNRRTEQAIADAGFAIESVERARAGPGTPAIYGVARRDLGGERA